MIEPGTIMPLTEGWLEERQIPEGKPYHCKVCDKSFIAGTRTLSCAVNHGKKGCCHYTDKEDKP